MLREFPYSNFHELNLDWALQEIKKLYDQTQDLQEAVNSIIGRVDEKVVEEINRMNDSGELKAIINELATPVYAEQNRRISVLEGRMDEFSQLHEGSTSGDAELVDIRAGYNGGTYTSAGNAVRAEIGYVSDSLRKNIANAVYNREPISITLGPSDFRVYSPGHYIDDNGVEQELTSWDIYQIELPFTCIVTLHDVAGGISGVQSGATYNPAIGNTAFNNTSVATPRITKSIKVNVWNTTPKQFAISSMRVTLYPYFKFNNAVSKRQPWSDCDRVVCFGDSIFYGYGANGNGTMQQFANMLGLPLVNNAVSNSNLSYHLDDEYKSVVKQVEEYSRVGAPLILIDGGTNDQYHYGFNNLGVYGEENASNINGAMKYIIEQLLSKGVPAEHIVVVTPIPKNIRGLAETNAVEAQLTTIGFNMWNICVVYGVNCLNGFNTVFNCGESSLNFYTKQFLMPDDTHPGELGSKFFANYIISSLS